MSRATSLELSPLIRQLREATGLTQAELAERVGTTQSVISRLESDDYEGHSLSMLNRIGAALNCRLTVGLAPERSEERSAERSEMATVRESALTYGTGAASTAGASDRSLSHDELDRVAERLARRFHRQGVTKADVKEALRWARGAAEGSALGRLRGAIKVGAGSTVDDVRRARAQRGRDIARAQ